MDRQILVRHQYDEMPLNFRRIGFNILANVTGFGSTMTPRIHQYYWYFSSKKKIDELKETQYTPLMWLPDLVFQFSAQFRWDPFPWKKNRMIYYLVPKNIK